MKPSPPLLRVLCVVVLLGACTREPVGDPGSNDGTGNYDSPGDAEVSQDGAVASNGGANGTDPTDSDGKDPSASSDAGTPPGVGDPNTPAVAGKGSHPFGKHTEYAAGVIYPNNHTREELDVATRTYYDAWKTRYLEPACADGQYRVKSQSATAAYTVSEAHGYGMLFVVLMEGYDPKAQQLFDGLYSYFRAHPSGESKDLMAWAQDAACQDVLGNGSAADGDLDIAYAMLLADAQWGSSGAINYKAEGVKVIAAVLERETAAQNYVQIGSWVRSDPRADGTRSSDMIPSYFRAYNKASGEARWMSAVDKVYGIVGHLQNGVASNSGLLPDFIVDADTEQPQPAPAKWLEGDHDGHYNYNACRDPWRIGSDYLLHSEARSRTAVRKINAFMRKATGDDVTKIVDGYDLNGNPYGGNAGPAFIGPLAVSAMIEPETGSNQSWLNALWDHLQTRDKKSYYNDSLQLAAMLVISGNFWAP